MASDNNASIKPHSGAQPYTPGKWGWLAWLPIPLLLAVIAALWVADLQMVWSLPLLFWLVHYGSPALAVAFVVIPAARSFMINRRLSILMLGCGTLVARIAVPVATIGYARGLDTYFGRELRMIELKKEVNELSLKAGLQPPYQIDSEKAQP